MFDKRNAVDAEWFRLKPTEGEALPPPPPPLAATEGAVDAGRWLKTPEKAPDEGWL